MQTVRSQSGCEPSLSPRTGDISGGFEPMLGGVRRRRIDRDLLRRLLDLEDRSHRTAAIERVLDMGAGRFYAMTMIAVLSPGSGYYKIGRLWKTSYSYEQKLAAMDSLVRLDGSHALGGLVVALGNEDPNLKRAAIWLISQLSGDSAERVLLKVVEDERPEIRRSALEALAHRWSEPNIARLANSHGLVVAEAAHWLGIRGHVKSLHVVSSVLRHRRRGSEDYVLAQSALVRAVGRIARRYHDEAGAAAVQTLRTILDDRTTTAPIYQSALQALRDIGTEEAQATAIVYFTSQQTHALA